jgi:hypothetical protein
MARNELKFWILWDVMYHWLLSPDIQRNTVPSPSGLRILFFLGLVILADKGSMFL